MAHETESTRLKQWGARATVFLAIALTVTLLSPFLLLGAMILGVLVREVVSLATTAILSVLVCYAMALPKLLRYGVIWLLSAQFILLTALERGWTAGSAFRKNTGSLVIDPAFDGWATLAFVVGAFVVMAALAAHLITPLLTPSLGSPDTAHSAPRELTKVCFFLLLEGVLLLCVLGNGGNWRASKSNVQLRSVSPDGAREVQLVPVVGGLADTNGIVIWRRPGSLLWQPIGKIGDTLTVAGGGVFNWSANGEAISLELKYSDNKSIGNVFTFDFTENKLIVER